MKWIVLVLMLLVSSCAFADDDVIMQLVGDDNNISTKLLENYVCRDIGGLSTDCQDFIKEAIIAEIMSKQQKTMVANFYGTVETANVSNER